MRFPYFLVLCFSMMAAHVWGQSGPEKTVTLRVVVDTTGIEKVNVVNLRTNQTLATNKKGTCAVRVKIGDILLITAVNLETRRHEISAQEYETQAALQKMSYRITPLEEVNVNENAHINETSLGIVSANQKKYTPATRKLRTAQTGLLDPLLNKMSGRTRDLKKQVKVEEKEKLLIKLDGLYEEKYYTDVLKIAPEAIPGFQYYLIDDPEFAAALKAKNKTLTMFYVKRLALQYNEILLRESHEQEIQSK